MPEKERVGEVIEASTTAFVAQCYVKVQNIMIWKSELSALPKR